MMSHIMHRRTGASSTHTFSYTSIIAVAILFLLFTAFTLTDGRTTSRSSSRAGDGAMSSRTQQASKVLSSPTSFAQLRASVRSQLGATGTTPGAGGGTGSAKPQQINVAVHAEMTDPITKLLHSRWVWLLFVLVILIIVCVIAYCFKDQVAVCVSLCETCLYHTVKFLLLPLKILNQCVRTCFYPFKQCFFAMKDRCNRFFYPSEMRVAGLRY